MARVLLSSIPPPPVPDHWIAGKYELQEIAGKGGMAVVWRAQQHGPAMFHRTVAVKQIHVHLRRSATYRDLFCEEARVGSVLQDPNIVQVLDFVEEDDQFFLVMEYVEGVDLGAMIRWVAKECDRQTRWEEMTAIGIGILRALSAAHERSADDGSLDPIVHRDLSPGNVLVNEKGVAKLIDFGLSFASDREIAATDPGMAKGKLSYLAPEIARGQRPSPASDQFTAGSVLWEALAGKRAFLGDSDFETYRLVANAELPKLSELRPDLPKELVAAVHKALAVEPSERFPSTRAMAQALGVALQRRRTKKDLYAAIASTVQATRQGLDIGDRTQDPGFDDTVDDSSSVELFVPDDDATKKVSKWLPAFLRRSHGPDEGSD